MKRIISTLLILILVLSLTVACGGKATETEVTTDTDTEVSLTSTTKTTTTTSTTSQSSTTQATTTTSAQTTTTTKATTAATTATTAKPTPLPAFSNANDILNNMSLSEKIGQMFIARCPETNAAALAGQYSLGGYILFARDFANETKDSAKTKIKSYQDASRIKMLIAVDEEGGGVVRVSKYPNFRATPFASQMYLYNNGGVGAILNDTREKCELLRSIGINMNFAPVCDLPDSPNDFIYNRSVSTDVNAVMEAISANVAQMQLSHTIGVLKHFPGYGNNVDTHTGIAVDNRPYSDFQNEDFKPFLSGINAGAPCVLVSHNIVKSMDANYPASLSASVHDILRNELGFTGVIITDDLAMGAITQYTNGENAAVLAVKAGNDLICTSDFVSQISAVKAAVESGEIPIERINTSVLRILNMKIQYGILG